MDSDDMLDAMSESDWEELERQAELDDRAQWDAWWEYEETCQASTDNDTK